MSDRDIVQKLRSLKELQTKVNEKVNILEQKMAGGLAVDLNINESYYEILSSKFA